MSFSPDQLFVYVILETAWEYNDESKQRSDGYHVTQSYLSKEEADAECLSRNLDKLKTDEITDYFYDFNDLDSDGLLFNKILKYGGTVDKDNNEIMIPNDLTQEQRKDIFDSLNLSWFCVQQITLE